MKDVQVKKDILLKYAKLCEKLAQYPTISELEESGLGRNTYRYHFGTNKSLREEARKAHPKCFKDVVDADRFNDTVASSLQKEINKYKRFIITTAVAGCPVNESFYSSVKSYCKKKKALLLVLPADNALQNIDKELVQNEHIVFSHLQLNSNIGLCPIKISPKQIDPITGLKRFTQRESSLVFASPKQRMVPVSTSNVTLPRVLMTTGAITEPRYHNKKLENKRMDFIATWDHVVGAIIVEVKDNKEFYFRQIQADKDGSFIDLGTVYNSDGTTSKTEANLILGDYHSGDTDPSADSAWNEISELITINYKVLHDFHNGLAINHHEEENIILRSLRAESGELKYEDEIKRNVKDLNKLLKNCKKLVMTKSNHDEFLDRWISEARYRNDPINHRIGLKLAQAVLDGKDPLKAAVELMGFDKSDRVVWLGRDDDFHLAGFQCGNHGDLGSNGKRNPGIKGLEEAYGKVIFGHTHHPEILRGAINVGTSSKLKLGYNRGASNWVHSSCILYPNGSFQLINSIEGRWRLKD